MRLSENKKRNILVASVIALFAALPFFVFGTSGISTDTSGTPLIKFTENKGQWDSKVLFRAQLDGGALFLEKNCFTYSFYEKEKVRAHHVMPSGTELTKEEMEIREHAFRVTLKNALPSVKVSSLIKSNNYSNFFIGDNPAHWACKAFDYSTVYYKNIYAGIDLEVNGKENSLKYNFIVQPGADPKNICLQYYGVSSISETGGALKIETPLTTIIENAPYAYQEADGVRKIVPCSFVLSDTIVTFSIGQNYNPSLPLIIDPTLVFSSYSGSLSDNFGMTATYDNLGNLYAGGTAFSPGYPTTPGAFSTSYHGAITFGRTDVVITKYNSSGNALIYSTYLGGYNGTEIVTSLIVNSNNQLMLFGMTGSSDFPVTSTAFDTSFGGGDTLINAPNGTYYLNGCDIYVSKFSAGGDSLLASTFVGGSENDGVNMSPILRYNYGDFYRGEIQTDTAGNFYVGSCSYSTNFPVTPGAFQTSPGGGLNHIDGVVFKMSPDLSQMLWSTFLGDSTDDCVYSLMLDKSYNVYVTGGTRSINFPTTSSTIHPSFIGGTADAFVSEISADGSTLLSSTFIGTPSWEQSYFVQRDTLEHIYLFGQSQGNFPVTGNVYSNPGSKQFIAILSKGLDTLLYSTVFGDGTPNIKLSPAAFLVDKCGNIYCSGWGGNIQTQVPMTTMPVTPDAFQPASANGFDFYFAVFGPYIQLFEYGTFFGGGQSAEHVDGGTSRFDPSGILYQSVCAGCSYPYGITPHNDFPTTPGAWSNTNNSNNCNNGVIKMNLNLNNTRAGFSAAPKVGCPYVNVSFTNTSIAAFNYQWDFGDGTPVSSALHPTHVFDSSGTFIVRLIAQSPFCGTDTVYDTIRVYFPPIAAFTDTGVYCKNNLIQFNNNSTNPATYLWRFGDNDSSSAINPSHAYSAPGTYTVTLIVIDSLGCRDTIPQNIIINPNPVAAFTSTIDTCELTAVFTASALSGGNYSWDFGDTQNDSGQNVSHIYALSGTYSVTLIVIDGNGCIDTVNHPVAPYSFAFADFIFSIDTCSLAVSFTNLSINALTNKWDFGDHTISSLPNPSHSYSEAGSYTVTLFLNEGTGCDTTATKNLSLDDRIFSDYFIPNIFTPNGDGYNPRFTILGLDFCDTYHIQIYNRWGELMYESSDITDAWDGRWKGKDVPDGVYYYIINGSRVHRTGTVTVKRK